MKKKHCYFRVHHSPVIICFLSSDECNRYSAICLTYCTLQGREIIASETVATEPLLATFRCNAYLLSKIQLYSFAVVVAVVMSNDDSGCGCGPTSQRCICAYPTLTELRKLFHSSLYILPVTRLTIVCIIYIYLFIY